MQSLRAPNVEAAIQIDPVTGRFSIARANYTDPAIFRAEMEHIFSKCWLYVGHDIRGCRAQSIRHARNVGGRSVIFLRDRDGHGALLSQHLSASRRADLPASRGQARNFICIYHGWAFDNTGRAISIAEPETYPRGLQRGGPQRHGAGAAVRDLSRLLVPELRSRRRQPDGLSRRGVRLHRRDRRSRPSRACTSSAACRNTAPAPTGSCSPRTAPTFCTSKRCTRPISIWSRPIPGGQMKRGKMEGKAIDLGNGHSVVERRATYGRPIAQWISLWGEEAKVEIDAIYDRLIAATTAKSEPIAWRNARAIC